MPTDMSCGTKSPPASPADAVIGDTDGTVVRMAVASFTLEELAERFPGLGLGW